MIQHPDAFGIGSTEPPDSLKRKLVSFLNIRNYAFYYKH
jgi:hypothetical protein